MPGYRLYFVDAAKHFTGSDEFIALHDHEAKEFAELRRQGHAAELWERGRCVFVFEGAPAATNNPFRHAE